jgi:L-ascorbate metabolism protein UlaG (beta-lactamase superfamily)
MKITKYIHSFVVVEKEDQRLLIDPGAFSFRDGIVSPETFHHVVGILITHAHQDHYHIESIKTILKNNSECKIYTNSEMKNILESENVSCATFETNEIEVGVFHVKPILAEHEPILNPAPTNTAFVIDKIFLFPGDSTDPILLNEKVDVVALPVDGPWQTAVNAFEFALKLKPKNVIPVHDGHIKEFFSSNYYQVWEKAFAENNIKFHKLLEPGDSIEIS